MSHPTAPPASRPSAPGPRPTDGTAGAQPSGPPVPLPAAPAPSAAPDLCGQPHAYKTKTGEQKTKPCVKARGHEGLHSSRNQSEKVDISILSGVSFAAEEVPTDEVLDVVTDRIRSAEQLAVDAAVKAGHAKWIAAGKPAGFNEAIKKGAATRYMVQPEHVAAIRTLLRRAENAPELKGSLHVRIAPPKTHASGSKMLYFIVVDKSATRSAAATATPAATPAATPPATPAQPTAAKPPATPPAAHGGKK